MTGSAPAWAAPGPATAPDPPAGHNEPLASLSERRKGPAWRLPSRRPAALVLGIVRRAVRDLYRAMLTTAQQSRWRRSRNQAIRAYLSSAAVPRLHLGSGPVLLAGWLNTDVLPRTPEHVFVDALDRFPFADDTFESVLSEHMIGDFSYPQCAGMLSECFRVLRPGGRLRLSTPDLERLMRVYAVPPSAESEHYVRWTIEHSALWTDACLPGFVINNFFQEYAFVYDTAVLGHLLRSAGFVDIGLFAPGASDTPALHGIDRHGAVVGDDRINRFESLTVEAVKPAVGQPAGGTRG